MPRDGMLIFPLDRNFSTMNMRTMTISRANMVVMMRCISLFSLSLSLSVFSSSIQLLSPESSKAPSVLASLDGTESNSFWRRDSSSFRSPGIDGMGTLTIVPPPFGVAPGAGAAGWEVLA